MTMQQLIMLYNMLGVVIGYSRKITHWFYRVLPQKAQVSLKTYLICPQIECMHKNKMMILILSISRLFLFYYGSRHS